jgi:hypothetical protein
MMNGAISKLIEANEHKKEEALIAGVGTVVGLTTAVKGLVKSAAPSYCSIM